MRNFELRSVNVILMKIDEVDNPTQREDVDMIDAFKEKATIEI